MPHRENINIISDIVLSELDYFGKKFQVLPMTDGSSVLANPNSSSIGVDKLQLELYIAQERLLNEPFIAYVKAKVDGIEKIFFICKGDTPLSYSPATTSIVFVNYLAPMGKIVEGEIGEEVEFYDNFGKVVYVLEKNIFTPLRNETWDGINNSFSLRSGTYSVKSLLDFKKNYDKKESTDDMVKMGLTRQIVDRMALRNQSVLDRAQGEIFRLPLSSQIIITGAPGTGKTTTVIKRIAQKSNLNVIRDEGTLNLNKDQISKLFHRDNWVMFTPTNLLKMFLKESFSKESVPASENTVKTWDDERVKIGRDTLQFLRIGEQGIYVRTPDKLLNLNTNLELIDYAKTFSYFSYETIYSNKLEKIYKFIWQEFYEFSREIREFILNEFYNFILDCTKLFEPPPHIDSQDIEALIGQLSKIRKQFTPKKLAKELGQIGDRWITIIEKTEAQSKITVQKDKVTKQLLGKKLNNSDKERLNKNEENLNKIIELKSKVQISFEEAKREKPRIADIITKIEQLSNIRESVLNFFNQTTLSTLLSNEDKETFAKDILRIKAKCSLIELNQIKAKWSLIKEITQIEEECQDVRENHVFTLIEQLKKIDSFYNSLTPQNGRLDLIEKFNQNTKRSFEESQFNMKKLKLIQVFNKMKERLGSLDPQDIENRIFTLIEQLDIHSYTALHRIIGDIIKNLLDGIPQYYYKFRMKQLKQDKILNKQFKKEMKDKSISDHEIDLLIFIILKNAHKIFGIKKDWLWQYSKVDLLENIKEKFKTLVTVDEATDFSTIQLGCMFYLSHPSYKSVSFSGDLMQRVTSFGLTDWNECKYLSDSFLIHSVNKVYRQSPKLLKIAETLYKENIKERPLFSSAFLDDENDPDPLKFNSENNDHRLGEWITERIIEIHSVKNCLPSIAIFVSKDEHIDRIHGILKEPLDRNNIEIVKCHGGNILNHEGNVRIFSVNYIKGLEFESVFFVDLDQISKESPELVDKYLYVGLTRAASFLAVTFNDKFPESLSYVKKYFKAGDWSKHIKMATNEVNYVGI